MNETAADTVQAESKILLTYTNTLILLGIMMNSLISEGVYYVLIQRKGDKTDCNNNFHRMSLLSVSHEMLSVMLRSNLRLNIRSYWLSDVIEELVIISVPLSYTGEN